MQNKELVDEHTFYFFYTGFFLNILLKFFIHREMENTRKIENFQKKILFYFFLIFHFFEKLISKKVNQNKKNKTKENNEN